MEYQPDILIVGGGSRALVLLERLIHAVSLRPLRSYAVVIADPNELGCGTHAVDQRHYIVFNTDSACPTVFVNERIPALPAGVRGPSFAEWLSGQNADADERFQPRSVVGRYLSCSARHLIEHLPPNLRVTHLREHVARAEQPRAGGLQFHTSTSTTIKPYTAVLASGHRHARAAPEISDLGQACPERVVTAPFPTHVQLRHIGRDHVVAIRGLGLTALDIVAELTEGRGGRFELDGAGNAVRYRASGDEPGILLFSRSSCPVRARPEPSAGLGGTEKLVILNEGNASELLAAQRPVAFKTDVFPLILAELVYRVLSRKSSESRHLPETVKAWAAGGGPTRSAAETSRVFAEPSAQRRLLAILRPVVRGDVEGARTSACAFLEEDIRESRRGTSGSALKHGLDVLLDARPFIKTVVDFRQDAFSDLSWIFGDFSALVNRNAIGPQHARSAELLALIRARIVDVMPSGSMISASDGQLTLRTGGTGHGHGIGYLIAADRPNTQGREDLVQSLIALGAARPITDTAGGVIGLSVDREMRVAGHRAQRVPLWAIGPVCEGSTYYNNYLPCIREGAQYPFFEANRIVDGLLAHLHA